MTEPVAPTTPTVPVTPVAPTTPTAGDPKVTFSPEQQEALNKMFGERAEQARRARETELLKELGVDNLDAAKAALKAADEARKAQMTDLEKAQTTAKAWEAKAADAQAKQQEVLLQLQDAKLRTAIGQGIKKAKLEFASDKAEEDAYDHLLRIVSFDDKGEVKGLDDALKALKEDRVYLFTAPTKPRAPQTNARDGGTADDLKTKQQDIARRFNLKRVPKTI